MLGTLVLAVDIALNGRADDPRRIVLNDSVYAQIAGVYYDNTGMKPSPQEMEKLTRLWVQNEMIYREARILGLDEGDEAIRSRLNLKLRDALANRAVVEKPDAQALEAWFEANREIYDTPVRYDFAQVFIEEGEAAARELADALEAGRVEAVERWENESRRYEARPRPNLAVAFGEDGAKTLISSEQGSFHVLESPRGWHVVSVVGEHPPVPARFEDVRGRVGEDYKVLEREKLLLTMYDEIADKFEVVVELETPPDEWDVERLDDVRLSETQASKRVSARFSN